MNGLLIDIGGSASPSWEVLRHNNLERVVIESGDNARLHSLIKDTNMDVVLVAGGTGIGDDSKTAMEIEHICNGRMLEGVANQIYSHPFHTGVAGMYNNTIVVTIPQAVSLEKALVLEGILADFISSKNSTNPDIIIVDFKGCSKIASGISNKLSPTFTSTVKQVLNDVELMSLLTSQSPSHKFILIPGNDGLSQNDTSADVILKAGKQLEGLTNRMYNNTIHRGVSSLVRNCVVTHVPVDVDGQVLRDLLLELSNNEVGGDVTPTELREEKVSSRPRKSPYEMIEMKLAHQLVEEHTPGKSGVQTIHTSLSLGRVLAESVFAPIAHPPFNASIKDGYAICADDFVGDQPIFSVSEIIGTAGASEILSENPGIVERGESKHPTAYRVSTGAAIPPHCDTVIQVENTLLIKEGDGNELLIQTTPAGYSISRWQDIRKEGSDIQKGSLLIPEGSIIQPGDIGLLSSMGITNISVKNNVHVVIMSTGNEIVSAGEDLPSKVSIFDSNRSILSSVLEQQFSGRHTLTDLGIVPDGMQEVKKAFDKAMNLIPKPDLIITSGGVSMGEKDFIKTVISSLPNSTTHFQRISMKPGKPTTFVTCGETAIFGLPGNPVSCLVCCQLFCVPAIKKMLGYPLKDCRHSVVTARLTSGSIKLDTERPEYHRVTVIFDSKSSSFVATSTGRQISSRLLSMREANALLHLPKGVPSRPTADPGDVFSCTLIGAFRTE